MLLHHHNTLHMADLCPDQVVGWRVLGFQILSVLSERCGCLLSPSHRFEMEQTVDLGKYMKQEPVRLIWLPRQCRT